MLDGMRSSLSGQGTSLARYGLARNGASLGMGPPSKSLESKIRAMLAKGWQGAWNAPNESISAPWYQDSAATTPIAAIEQFIGNARDKGGRGNHAIQATAAARPALSARVNYLQKTEQFDNAYWTKRGAAAVTPNATIAPDGTSTADLLTVGISATDDIYTATVTPAIPAGPYVPGIYIKRITTTGNLFLRNPQNASNGTWSVNLSLLSNNWELITATHPAVTVTFAFTSVGASTVGLHLTASAPGTQVYAWGASATTQASRYQRVNTATDYDTDGFQKYEKFDGIDDNLGSPTGGGGTAGFFFCQAVKPTGGAGTVRRIWSDRDTASFTGLSVQINASNQLEISAGNGAAYTSIATARTLAVGATALITAWDDGANLNVQIDDGAVASIARPVVVAGTAGFTRGKDNGAASGFFTGNAYASLYRIGPVMTLPEIANAQIYARQQAGL